MPVVSINLKSVSGKKENARDGEVKVNNKVAVTDIKEINLPGINQSGLAIGFDFLTKYSSSDEDVAVINITGEAMMIGGECKDIVKQWKKNQTIPEDPHIEIINTIFRKCVSKAIVMAEDLQLPPPVGLPFVQKQKKE